MKKTFIIIVLSAIIVSCNSPEKKIRVEKPEEKIAIENIKFFVPQEEYVTQLDKFLESHENYKYEKNILMYHPHIALSFHFDYVKEQFLNGKLIGVSLFSNCDDKLKPFFVDNYNSLYSYINKKYGKPKERNLTMSENDIKEKGTIATDLWKVGHKSILIEYTYKKDIIYLVLNIFRNDQINKPKVKSEMEKDADRLGNIK